MPEHRLPAFALLLAGGTGTRLWPVSRELYPKQLVKLIGKDSLVQNTIKRLSPVVPNDSVRIVCGREHFNEIGRHMAGIDIDPGGKIIAEPCGRNTAPAILLGVLQILKTQSDAIICVFPADHVIRDVPEFHEKLDTALDLADAGHVVTFGIQADYPETGYGYIEGDAPVGEEARKIKRFVEKPDLETAKEYIRKGNYYWNSGMFAFRASVILREFETHQPELYRRMAELLTGVDDVSAAGYEQLPDISIDYAIMEKTGKGVVLPSQFGWSDIGSWKSLYDFLPKDPDGNVLDGDVIAERTANSFIMGAHRLIATNTVENLVVVDTPDSVFISNLENSRDVKAIVSKLKAEGRREYHHHRTVYHPWGTVTLLARGDGYRVERFNIYPDAGCPLAVPFGCVGQVTVTHGKASLTIGDDQRILSRGETGGIAQITDARIDNAANTPLHVIHVQIEKFPGNGQDEFPREIQ